MRTDSTNADEQLAFERLDRACNLIQSAYRLYPLDPSMVVTRVKAAITAGAEELAADVAEAASAA